ncbi:diacylglycerol kinase family protein [Glycomyces artemisiae]|uniref:Diacylglycerol kinase-like protein n=1 Tax=Glycomyces artemisiae TaxID=1076443 RepID=A0A2T0UR72_9ACTN|nr:diacylglycerol kinase family protein [Glycomyces artemisiae]PRY60420.1 diacylglycerol kinase-like protein [Glycomyces artemisiae]
MNVVVLTLVESDCSNPGPRTQALHLADELKARGAAVRTVEARTPEDIDQAAQDPDERIVLAADTDEQVNAVVARLTRLAMPAPSMRPEGLPDGRTIPDLPALAVLPLGTVPGIVVRLGLPEKPADVAEAVVSGAVKRTDLMRHDGGGVAVDGVRLGGGDRPWRGVVNLDDVVLADGSEQILACVVANADGYAAADDMVLAEPDPADGKIDVAVAVPVMAGRFRKRLRIEVRRAKGRAVAVHPADTVTYIQDGLAGQLGRKRTWWIEPGAAGWYTA